MLISYQGGHGEKSATDMSVLEYKNIALTSVQPSTFGANITANLWNAL